MDVHAGTICPSDGAPIHLAAFDPSEELLWSASQGMVYGHLMPSGEAYAAFCADDEMPIVGIYPHPFGVIALTHNRVRFFGKGGMRMQEARDEQLGGVCAGTFVAGDTAPYLACAMAPTHGGKPSLGLVDLNTARMASVVQLESTVSVMCYEPSLHALIAGGADGTVSIFDVRTSARAAGRATVFSRGMVRDMDCSGHTLAAAGLFSRLGPLGQQEFTYDSSLHTLDLRKYAGKYRPGPDIQFAPGTAQLRWHPTMSNTVIAASPEGLLQTLDAVAYKGAPSQLRIEAVAEDGAQVCSLAVAPTAQLVAIGDSHGSLHIGAATEKNLADEQEAPMVNQYSQPTELPEPDDDDLPEVDWDAPVGHLPLMAALEGEPLASYASYWKNAQLGRKNELRVDAAAFVRASALPPPQQIAFGSVSVQFYPNSLNRRRNQQLPLVAHPSGAYGASGAGEEDEERPIPERFSRFRRMKVQLGKFGLHEDFSFQSFNQSAVLATLDNTVPNAYCNSLLLVLYLLPWTRAHCLGALSESQFVLSDELGFLFHMMDRSSGSCCQPRNFQRAFHQSREATALKLVDAVDVEGNVAKEASLPDIICKFTAFVLEQLSKEAREAQREANAATPAATDAVSAAAAAAAAVSKAGRKGDAKGKLSLDEQVALEYAQRLAEAKPKPAPASTPSAPSAATAAGGGEKTPAAPNVFELVFEAAWHETLHFPGVKGAADVVNDKRSLVMPLVLPDKDAAASAAEKADGAAASAVPSFVETLSHCIAQERHTKSWCAEAKGYRHALQRKQLRAPPNVWCMLCSQLPNATMEAYEEANGGAPWLPLKFHLTLPPAAKAEESAPVEGEAEEGAPPAAAAAAEAAAAAASAESSPASARGGSGAAPSAAAEAAPKPTISLEPPPGAGAEGDADGDGGAVRYGLQAVIAFTRSTLTHASEGSGHLTLAFRVPPRSAASVAAAAAAAANAAAVAAAEEGGDVDGEGVDALLREIVGELVTAAIASAATEEGDDDDDDGEGGGGRPRRASNLGVPPAEMVSTWEEEGAQWYIWNDFALAAATEAEVLALHSEWRRPCVLLYSRAGLADALGAKAVPLDAESRMTPAAARKRGKPIPDAFSLLHAYRHSLEAMSAQLPKMELERRRSFTPLGATELPLKRGSLVAIDAEFVACTRELTRPGTRGKKAVVVKPARLSLARVSCLRGEGQLAGVPFIDAYVQQAEPVVDHLTKYSGLHPGDLDPSVSRHHITTMKSAYLQLRQLVDAGCVFVGHGLKKDFEMINVVIPQAQIVDTVNLFYSEAHKRRISLRFLAYHLLGMQMTNRLHDTHDSIEDARTALQLYTRYLELKAQGALDEAINMLYQVGEQTNWEVPE